MIGATGFLGQAICSILSESYEVVVVSRSAEKARKSLPPSLRIVECDYRNLESISFEFEGCDAVINLAGDNISEGIWTARKKEIMRKSRVDTTHSLVKVLTGLSSKPRKLLQASAVGIYGDRKDDVLDEESTAGRGFLADLVHDWEKSASGAEPLTEVVYMRIGIVIGPGGGALEKIVPVFKAFAGGHLGSGDQYMSVIHIADITGIVSTLLKSELKGPVNLVSPKPVTSRHFFKALGEVLDRPSWFHVPGFLLKLAPGKMGEELFLASQRVVSNRLSSELGYEFKYADVSDALQDVVQTRS